MKGKRYSTEEKIRILRQATSGWSTGEVIREANISDATTRGGALRMLTILDEYI